MMIARVRRAALVLAASAVALVESSAEAQAPSGDVQAATPGEGAPAQVAPSAPLAPERPPIMPPPTTPPLVRRVDASEPRKITGIVLTAIGAYHGFAGSVVIATFAGVSEGFGFLSGLIIGGPLMADGLIFISVGIPLWVSGAKTVEKVDPPFSPSGDPRAARRWVPSVEVGAGNASATWHF